MKGAYFIMPVKRKKWNISTVCMMALLIAMMFLLKRFAAIEPPHMKINFASLPVVLASMMFGPVEGAIVAVVGELIAQITGIYGLSPTTFIWIWPPAIRALVVGFTALWVRNTGSRLENRPVICYVSCVMGAILTTTGNTFGMWLDSLFYRTSFTPVLFITPARYVTGVVTAVLVATVCIPLMHGLRRSGVLKYAD